jgi:hypothetical protein
MADNELDKYAENRREKFKKNKLFWHKTKVSNFYMPKKWTNDAGNIDKLVLKGWLPKEPFISKENIITAFGSCFAASLTQYLQNKGYTIGKNIFTKSKKAKCSIHQQLREEDAHIISYSSTMNNTFTVRQQFEWAFEGKSFDDKLWYNEDGEFVGYSADIQENTRKIFEATDVFIITLGLSEIWYNKITNDVFWRSMPADKFDEKIHGFRVSTVQENIDNLETVYQILKKHKPNAELIITLSPIPLVATMRPVSCITANNVSKAILRSAADEVYQAHSKDEKFHYWPSYEIVQWFGNEGFKDDNRHITGPVKKLIMEKFEQYYCKK